MGRLDVRVVEARNLADTQWISKPDPYVIISLENQRHKTKVKDNDTNPKWDEVFKFTVADENSSRFPSSRYRTETTDLVFDFPREDHLKPSVVGRIGSRGRTHDAPPVSTPFVRS